MDKADKLFRHYVNLYKDFDKKELLAVISNAKEVILPLCKVVDKENNGNLCFAMMVSSAFGADGKLTKAEAELLTSLGINVETYKAIMAYDDLYRFVDTIFDAMTINQKATTMSFMIALCALDGKVASKENAFLKKLLD